MNSDDSRWEPEQTITPWKRTFVITAKKSNYGTRIRPLSLAYKRYFEVYSNGQSLMSTEWLTPPEYLMELLKKGEVNANNF